MSRRRSSSMSAGTLLFLKTPLFFSLHEWLNHMPLRPPFCRRAGIQSGSALPQSQTGKCDSANDVSARDVDDRPEASLIILVPLAPFPAFGQDTAARVYFPIQPADKPVVKLCLCRDDLAVRPTVANHDGCPSTQFLACNSVVAQKEGDGHHPPLLYGCVRGARVPVLHHFFPLAINRQL